MAESLSRYEFPTFPKGLADVPVENGRAILPSRPGISNKDGYDTVGNVTGNVVEVSTGLQMLTSFPGETVGMKLFMSGDRSGEYGPRQHLAYVHGKVSEESYVVVDHNCLGGHMDVDCGCRHATRHGIASIYADHNADSGVYITVDPFMGKKEKIETARNMMEALGAASSPFIHTTEGFDQGCDFTQRFMNERGHLGQFEGVHGDQFELTHDMQVTFHGGIPARLLVLEQPEMEDKRGFVTKPRRHEVLLYGNLHNPDNPPVFRYHSSCITSELGGNGCDCETQQARTFASIINHGAGVFILAEEEGMGSGLPNKLWQTQYTGSNETDLLHARENQLGMQGDTRTYDLIGVVRQITGVDRALHASNNHLKEEALLRHGIDVVGHVQLPVDPKDYAPQAYADFIAKHGSGRYMDYMDHK